MQIAIRVDSGAIIGSGHLMRCIALADALKKHGVSVDFICRDHNGHLIPFLLDKKYQVHILRSPIAHVVKPDLYKTWIGSSEEEDANDVISILKTKQYDWIIVDHYGISELWERIIKPSVKRLMVIDDLANRRHICDLLVDQSYFGEETIKRYQNLVYNYHNVKKLLGPRYAMLQPEYLKVSKICPFYNGDVNRVLIFFGNNDVCDETSQAIEALSCQNLLHLYVDVVIGSNHPNPGKIASLVTMRPRTNLHHLLPSLANIMASSDLMLGAGGTTTWERMRVGLPAIVKVVAQNQQDSTERLIKDKYQIGYHLSGWKESILLGIKDKDFLVNLSRKAQNLVDGFGTARIVQALLDVDHCQFFLRKAHYCDEELLFDWVSDEIVKNMSLSQKKITRMEHASWFSKKMADDNCIIFIAENRDKLPVGQVRFEHHPDIEDIYIDISIDFALRGKNLAFYIVKKGIDSIRKVFKKGRLVAEVREENTPSRRLFEKLEFTPVLSQKRNVITYVLQI